ncbi:MAG: hypothetical protein ISQ13_00395 [Candidatus Margulisbacteria bacterium]|nr:hypothetical protein [Candidatus Margulisiibacteriota bacterium]
MYRFNAIVCGALLFCGVAFSDANIIQVQHQQIDWKTQLGNDYSPYNKRGTYYKALIELNMPSPISGDYFMGVALNGADMKRTLKNDQNQQLVYFLTSKTNTNFYMLDWPDITSQEQVIPFRLNGETVKYLPIYIWVEPGQYVPSTLFKGDIVLNIYQGSIDQTGQPEIVGGGTLSLGVKVSDKIELSIGSDQPNALSEFKVGFETLKKGEMVAYDVFVYSVDAYELTVTSKEKGRLAHELPQVKTSIPYDMSIDHQWVQFDEFGVATFRFETADINPKYQHKIKVVLGDARHAFKGKYSDRIILHASKTN